MVEWHHLLNGHEFEQTPEDSEGQGSLLWGSPWNLKELDMTTHPVHPKGNQSWVFIERTDAEAETPILWPPDVKS